MALAQHAHTESTPLVPGPALRRLAQIWARRESGELVVQWFPTRRTRIVFARGGLATGYDTRHLRGLEEATCCSFSPSDDDTAGDVAAVGRWLLDLGLGTVDLDALAEDPDARLHCTVPPSFFAQSEAGDADDPLRLEELVAFDGHSMEEALDLLTDAHERDALCALIAVGLLSVEAADLGDGFVVETNTLPRRTGNSLPPEAPTAAPATARTLTPEPVVVEALPGDDTLLEGPLGGHEGGSLREEQRSLVRAALELLRRKELDGSRQLLRAAQTLRFDSADVFAAMCWVELHDPKSADAERIAQGRRLLTLAEAFDASAWSDSTAELCEARLRAIEARVTVQRGA